MRGKSIQLIQKTFPRTPLHPLSKMEFICFLLRFTTTTANETKATAAYFVCTIGFFPSFIREVGKKDRAIAEIQPRTGAHSRLYDLVYVCVLEQAWVAALRLPAFDLIHEATRQSRSSTEKSIENFSVSTESRLVGPE